MGSAIGGLFGGETDSERNLSRTATAHWENNRIQGFLPDPLRAKFTNPIIGEGIQGIGELIRNPGRLSPGVAEAILPRLAAESENIAQNFRGLGSNQQGAAARGNVPISIKSALQSALDVAQERAQRGSRREALMDSEGLRRQDLSQVFTLLDALLQFVSSGRGQAVAGLGQAAQSEADRQSAQMQAIGNILGSAAMP